MSEHRSAIAFIILGILSFWIGGMVTDWLNITGTDLSMVLLAQGVILVIFYFIWKKVGKPLSKSVP
jgi:hypothetical protein